MLTATAEPFGPLVAGDIPGVPVVVTLSRVPAGVTGVTAALVRPDRDSASGVLTLRPPSTLVGDRVEVDTTGVIFNAPGVWRLTLTLTGSADPTDDLDIGRWLSVAPIEIVVEAVDGWHNLASARRELTAAPRDDVQLYRLLTIAREQVEAFASRPTPRPVPAAWREAQRLQVRNILNVSAGASDGTVGGGEFAYRPHPLDWHVRQLITPTRGGIGGAV